jgi:hypothetical protein
MLSMLVLQGVLVTYKDGQPLAREHYQDDGKTLTCTVEAMGKKLVEEVSRQPRKVRFDVGGKKGESEIPEGTIVLENLIWEQYALAAEGRPADGQARPVKVLLPAQNVTVDATIAVRATPGGGKHVEVAIAAIKVEVELSANGVVARASVPAQQLEVRPEGAPVPVAQAPRSAPSGIVEELVEGTRDGVTVRGTLWLPPNAATEKPPLLLLIAGSGPTDRDGNSKLGLASDCYRMLAEALVRRGAAVLRFDKRGVGQSPVSFDPAKLVLDDMVGDAQGLLEKMQRTQRFSSLVLAGHSEGGTIATLLAARVPVDGLVLLAAPGRPMATLLHEQLARQLDAATLAELERQLAALRAGQPVDTAKLPAAVAALLNPSVRSYIKSELDLDPAAELSKLKLPTTIVQGTTDVQVSVADARLLAAARPDARLVLLEHANHLFKEEAKATLGQPSYTDPSRPLVPGLVDAVANAVKLPATR